MKFEGHSDIMNSAVSQNGFFRLSKGDLIKLKLRALRSGAWFRALRRVERVLVDLTFRVVHRVRSRVLAKALLSIMKKLEDASENRVSRALREIGFPCARRLSLLAQKWGNRIAETWAFDFSFARFIAIMHINTKGIARLL
jgi:hypothetical protein